ncbi:nuclear transport factor 2 family protein [Streptomyces spiralis]|uniref:nuclear transport factor 2 family protein n=1 Tax=Streptomyces spiralis TaxID=66376 RepID=UPI0033C40715
MEPLTDALQRLVDERDVADVLHRYAAALDGRDWDGLEACFTPDAAITMSVAGGYPSAGHYRRQAESVLGGLDVTHHVFSAVRVRVNGDTATADSCYHAQHVRAALAPDHLLLIGGWVHDELVRTGGGWRISVRRGTAAWYDGNPWVIGRASLPLRPRPWRALAP